MDVTVRAARRDDKESWLRMRTLLWSESPDDHPREIASYFENSPPWICLVATSPDDAVLGFAEVAMRAYGEGCSTSPVGYVEGIFVDEPRRGEGIGRALVDGAEAWARSRGCSEMASDRALDNDTSGAFHEAVGFEETATIVCYRKQLR